MSSLSEFLPNIPGKLTQNRRLFQLDTVLGDDKLLLEEFRGWEYVSKPYVFALSLLAESKGNPTLKELVGTPMTIRQGTALGTDRLFHGYVASFRKVSSVGDLSPYRAILQPFLAFMACRKNSRIYQQMTRSQIIRKICAEYGAMAEAQFKLFQQEKPITMCVQYEETDQDFIMRLAEEAGWIFYFEHKEKSHRMIFRDNSTLADEMPLSSKVVFNTETGASDRDTVVSWCGERVLAPTKVALRTFDFKNPSDPKFSESPTGQTDLQLPSMESYRYFGAHTYADWSAGNDLAKLLMEEADGQAKWFEGEGNVRQLQPGYWFELKGHHELDKRDLKDRKFLMLEVEHRGRNNYKNGVGGYSNSFKCSRLDVPYHPERNTPRPIMRGPQTAIVVGPENEEIYCDNLGRVCIQLPWDRDGKFNDQSSCWVRVSSQWAGSRFGFKSVPRIGTEVVVDFLEGNPDRPIITGAVYNTQNMPPWELPNNKTQSGIYTNSTPKGTYENANALRFEDKKGSEEVWLHAEKDQRIEVENDESHSVGHDRKKTIGNSETTHVTVNRTETVGGNEDVTITGHKTTRISQWKSETVDLASTEHVGLGRNLTVGAAYTTEVGGLMETVVLGAQTTQVGLLRSMKVGQSQTTTIGTSYTMKVGKDYDTTIGGNCTYTVTGVLKLQAGKSVLELHPDGTVILNGNILKLDGSTSVQVTGQHVDLN